MHVLLEILREFFFIQEDIRIVELLVKSVFHLLDAVQDPGEVTVPC